MYRRDGQLVLSASDVVNFVGCGHLTAFDVAALDGRLVRPHLDDPQLALIAAHGLRHEADHLANLESRGVEVVRIDALLDEGGTDAVAATWQAMCDGAAVIFQAELRSEDARLGGWWEGHVDFLERVELPDGQVAVLSDPATGRRVELGWTYRPVDTKLARRVKSSAVLQLAVYRRLLATVLTPVPADAVVVTGDGQTVTVDLQAIAAYVSRTEQRLIEAVESAVTALPADVPYPVAACATCRWSERCTTTWRETDHLSLVANIRRTQVDRLEPAGITTVKDLAEQDPAGAPSGMAASTFATLVRQAHAQRTTADDGPPHVELSEPAGGRGLALLPDPNDGDVFFDMEGDPFAEGGRGLEYLFGVVDLDPQVHSAFTPDSERVVHADGGGAPALYGGATDMRFLAWWAHDEHEERIAFERFIAYVVARRRQHPGLHVYHYAAYENTALRRLAAQHATCEDEVDQLLRDGVLIDLFKVVRQAMVIGSDSYSIKQLEPLYMAPRDGEVTNAASSIVEYERWQEDGDPAVLAAIRAYNRDDVVSTRLLRDWLEAQRAELEASRGVSLPRPPRSVGDEEAPDPNPGVAEAIALEAAAADVEDDAAATLRLVAHLVGWHRREARPTWREFFHRQQADASELWADSGVVIGLRPRSEPQPDGKSWIYRYAYDPTQPTKLDIDTTVHDLHGDPAGTILDLDPDAGHLDVRKGGDRVPVPAGLMLSGPLATKAMEDSLLAFARWLLQHASGPAAALTSELPDWQAARDLLRRHLPRVDGHDPSRPLMHVGEGSIETLTRLLRDLARSTLPVQGPPGTGKTYAASYAILAALRQGRRIGVCANSHAAIANLIDEVVERADEAGEHYPVLHKSGPERGGVDTPTTNPAIATAVRAASAEGNGLLVGGTSWLFAREELADTLDVLIVDEAGQLSLANAIAISRAADNLVLIGDPQQLPQPIKGVHPAPSGDSALEYLLHDRATIPDQRGVFLPISYRMHPDICRFVSALSYDGRLASADDNHRQRIDATDDPQLDGTGLLWVPVPHAGRASVSPEEAAAVTDLVSQLLNGRFTASDGTQRDLTEDDVLVVAAYNAQVARVRTALHRAGLEHVAVGTVDRFQGQQAPVVVFTLASSTAQDAPRDLDFLFSPNRWNVAISRAQARTIVVGSPELLDAPAGTYRDMLLINGLCAYVAAATAV